MVTRNGYHPTCEVGTNCRGMLKRQELFRPYSKQVAECFEECICTLAATASVAIGVKSFAEGVFS